MKAAIVLASLLFASVASAKGGPSKPSVCVSYELIETKRGTVATCFDGTKPKVFSMWSEVTWRDEDGKPAKYLLGF
jgi:hypothetical protein